MCRGVQQHMANFMGYGKPEQRGSVNLVRCAIYPIAKDHGAHACLALRECDSQGAPGVLRWNLFRQQQDQELSPGRPLTFMFAEVKTMSFGRIG